MNLPEELSFLFPFTMLVFGATFLLVGWRGVPSARWWGAGYLSAGGAFFVPVALGALPVAAQALTANALFLAAFVSYGQALLLRFGRPRRLAAVLGFAGTAYAVIAHAVLVQQSFAAEALASDVACALLLAFPLFSVRQSLARGIDKALFALVFLVFAETVLRTLYFQFAAPLQGGPDVFLGSTYAFVMQMTASLLALLLALTALGAVALDTVEGYREAAERDPMTGLLNRRGFERAVGAPGTAAAAGAVVVLDIDHFKRVNDQFGHVVGDRVIVAFARVLDSLRPKDGVVARFGGEEFVFFLPGYSTDAAALLSNRIRRALAERDWISKGVATGITASFGAAATEVGETGLAAAIGRADQRLYRAKANGRDRVVADGEDATVPTGAAAA